MKHQQGFSLLEVLIATAIMLFGVAGYVQLQAHYIKLDHTLHLRQQGLFLAAKKLADLKSFSVLRMHPDHHSYQEIVSDGGGAMPPGVTSINLWQDQEQSSTFDLHWQVTNMYFIDTDNDNQPDTWLAQGEHGLPSTLPVIAPKKALRITVSWQDQVGETLMVALDSNIAPVPFSRSAHVTNNLLGRNTPLPVTFVTPETGVDLKHEIDARRALHSRAPLIDVQAKSIEVKIEQTKLTLVLPEEQKEKIENQVIVGCQCRLGTLGIAKTPLMTVLKNSTAQALVGYDVIKQRGVAEPGQHERCAQCCRDHHDTEAMVSTQHYYRLEEGAGHKHYQHLGADNYQIALLDGDEYQEVCRFKLVDGLYHLASDLELLALNEFGLEYTDTQSNRTAYTTYVKQLLSHHIVNSSSPPLLERPVINSSLGQQQLVARGIYVERLFEQDKHHLSTFIRNHDEQWFTFMPFFDVDLTLLANWYSSDRQKINILEQAIQTVENVEQDYYASYQRGVIDALQAGRTKVHAQISPGNSGLVGRVPLSAYDATNRVKGEGLEVIVQP